jgi:hypothetical protein
VHPSAGPPAPVTESGRARRQFAPVLVLLLGLAVTGILTWTCWTVNDHNESRLLRLRVKDVGTVLATTIPNVESPLASAADIARVTNGDAARFTAYVAPCARPKGPFMSVALYQLEGSTGRLITAVGKWPAPAPGSPQLQAAMRSANATRVLNVSGIFSPPRPRTAYALSVGSKPQFVVYAESAVHPRQPLKVAKNSGPPR